VTVRRSTAVAAVLLAAVCLAAAGCGDGGSATRRAQTAAATTTGAATTPGVSHAAPELEGLLPNRVAGVRLAKGSTTGVSVLTGTAFGGTLTRLLAGAGKHPSDLRFANAQDPKGNLELEVGVFAVRGLSAPALLEAIVRSSRPNAPGLTATRGRLGGKPVTKVVYPGGAVLYLYAHGGKVFYVGTQQEALAQRALELLG
jgi:hypothetical protein